MNVLLHKGYWLLDPPLCFHQVRQDIVDSRQVPFAL